MPPEQKTSRPRLARALWGTGATLALAFVAALWFQATVPERGVSERIDALCDRFRQPESLRDFPHAGPVSWERDRLTDALTVSGRSTLNAFESWTARHQEIKQRMPIGMDRVEASLASTYGLSEGARYARVQYFERNVQVDVFIQEDGLSVIQTWRMSSR